MSTTSGTVIPATNTCDLSWKWVQDSPALTRENADLDIIQHYTIPSQFAKYRRKEYIMALARTPYQASNDAGGTIMTEETANKITGDMSITEIITKFPQTVQVFQQFGLGCLGCVAASFENLQMGAQAHGMDYQALIDALNKAIE